MIAALYGCALGSSARRGWIFVAAALLAATAAAKAETLSFLPTKDNTLYQDAAGSLSNGQGAYLFSGRTKDGFIRRGLMALNLSAIPAGKGDGRDADALLLEIQQAAAASRDFAAESDAQLGRRRVRRGGPRWSWRAGSDR